MGVYIISYNNFYIILYVIHSRILHGLVHTGQNGVRRLSVRSFGVLLHSFGLWTKGHQRANIRRYSEEEICLLPCSGTDAGNFRDTQPSVALLSDHYS